MVIMYLRTGLSSTPFPVRVNVSGVKESSRLKARVTNKCTPHRREASVTCLLGL